MFNKFSVAPLLNYTDKHCRYFYSLFTKCIKLYTGMVHVSSFLRRYKKNKLSFNYINTVPVAIQFAGSNRNYLYKSALIAKELNFSEINFNLGCPSLSAKFGKFGYYLSNDILKIINCLKSLQDGAPDLIISVKHRINCYCYNSFLDFVGNISLFTSCKYFIIHARSVLKNNYSTKLNLSIPLLNYKYVYKLKKDLPHLNIVINGNINNLYDIEKHLKYVDGVMIGRGLYFNPLILFCINDYFCNKCVIPDYYDKYNNNCIFFNKKNKINFKIRLILFKIYLYVKIFKIKFEYVFNHIIYIFYKIDNANLFRKRLIMSLNYFNKFLCYSDFEYFLFKDFI